MKQMHKSTLAAAACLGCVLAASPAVAGPDRAEDFGAFVQERLAKDADKLFGIKKPLEASSIADVPRAPGQRPEDLFDLAKGLKAEIFSREVSDKSDQLAFWPNDERPTHIIICVEEFGPEPIGSFENGTVKFTPGGQRIDLKTREVETIIRGTAGCDGVERTPWGTVLFTEEDGRLGGDGHLGNAYEVLDPLATTNVRVHRGAERGTFSDATGVVKSGAAAAAPVSQGGFGIALRDALPEMSWEGIAITEQGVLIAGDELRPGSRTSGGGRAIGGQDTDGGAIFKFVPSLLRMPGSGDISSLAESPFAMGSLYAARVDCRESTSGSFPQYGQGCQKGNAGWVQVNATTARADANAFGATGYYRPEDLDPDPNYAGEGIRFCWANTGRARAFNFGEVLCAVDTDPAFANTGLVFDEDTGSMRTAGAPVNVQVFVAGDGQLNQPDNVAFQAASDNVYVLEDNSNGDIFACLPDGDDRDTLSDGCVLILTLKDPTAEPTGFMFTADNKSAFFFVQHSADDNDPLVRSRSCNDAIPEFTVDDYCTDDMILVSGFDLDKVRRGRDDDDKGRRGRGRDDDDKGRRRD